MPNSTSPSSTKQLMGRAVLVSLSLLAFSSLSFAGQATQTTPPDDEPEKAWAEVDLQLPAAPKPENLVNFYKSDSQSFAIDKLSLSVAGDGTIRYTLVATSNAGAKNISYEAIRCETYEHKLFAFGRSDGSWSRSRRNQWDKIFNTGANKQHHILFTEYFCEGTTVAGKAPFLLSRLQGKGSPFIGK
ncbi:CNP1-like family protein [Undibacterium sp. Dicai25W]|uniref:CNP1-like family protein n=1 Tax=Undibacterium sp. Dicai25W TaxID=3413034 RepID=UPI003BF1EEF0